MPRDIQHIPGAADPSSCPPSPDLAHQEAEKQEEKARVGQAHRQAGPGQRAGPAFLAPVVPEGLRPGGRSCQEQEGSGGKEQAREGGACQREQAKSVEGSRGRAESGLDLAQPAVGGEGGGGGLRNEHWDRHVEGQHEEEDRQGAVRRRQTPDQTPRISFMCRLSHRITQKAPSPPGPREWSHPSDLNRQPTAYVTASTAGLVVRSENGVVVLDLDGDGFEQTGWVLIYLHIATQDRVANGAWVETGDLLGHPSCEGGHSTGTHVHMARKYNGEWMAADGAIPLVLTGWRVHAGERPYQGTLTRDGETVTASTVGAHFSKIVRDHYP
ncbi:MAG TPA: hypothetical protein EYP77_01145 [Anaerolineae bacterium]|nr:hypothetical protein [Anaerolineae bacterium]